MLRHSLDAFVMNDYHGTTVRDIAKRLGQTVPAIYYHYENKQALLVALLTKSIDDLLDRCTEAEAEARAAVADDPAQRLTYLVRCVVLYVANRQQLAFLDAEIRSLESENRAGLHRTARPHARDGDPSGHRRHGAGGLPAGRLARPRPRHHHGCCAGSRTGTARAAT